jgi:hypothetical protein
MDLPTAQVQELMKSDYIAQSEVSYATDVRTSFSSVTRLVLGPGAEQRTFRQFVDRSRANVTRVRKRGNQRGRVFEWLERELHFDR